ncbi:NAD-dependent epimerase/dehydratase family protein [Vibrio breoganii]
MSILLTGANGFIGKCLHGVMPDIGVVIRSNKYYMQSPHFVIQELNKECNWTNAFEGVDSIIHLAGLAHSNSYSDEDYQTVNVGGTLHFALEAAKAGVKRFVFVSSIVVNGSSTEHKLFSPTSKANPQNAYAQSKYDAELGLKKIANDTGLELVIVRPTLVYGIDAPGNFGSLKKLVTKLPFLPFGLVSNKRDFIAVQNLADLLITCANHPNAAGHTFLASDGESVSIKEFTNAISKGLNKSLFQLPIPVAVMRLAASLFGKSAMADQLLGNLQVDSTNAQDVLGWTPPYTISQAMASLSEDKK